MNNIKTTEAKIRSLIARLLALFGLALIYVLIEVLSFPVMAYITTKYDKTLHTSYDQTSVTTSSGLTYDKASTGRACQYLPQTNTVDPNSCIDAIILAGIGGLSRYTAGSRYQEGRPRNCSVATGPLLRRRRIQGLQAYRSASTASL
jgi:hypothetical protein